MRKNRTVAALLALFLGGFGVHWFYLNRTGLGILHAVFFWTPLAWISGIFSAILWLGTNDANFEERYLSEIETADYKKFDTDYSPRKKRRRSPDYRTSRPSQPVTDYSKSKNRVNQGAKIHRRKAKSFIKAGKAFFAEYDLPAAIEQFDKALELDPRNPAIHFNLACAYSLSEQTERAIYHLNEAIRTGFNDFEKIKTHDALAYLRVQPEFNTFEAERLKAHSPKQVQAEKTDNLLDSTPDLLDQLKKLQLMRQTGQITEKAFQTEKRKLFS